MLKPRAVQTSACLGGGGRQQVWGKVWEEGGEDAKLDGLASTAPAWVGLLPTPSIHCEAGWDWLLLPLWPKPVPPAC